VVKDDDSAGAAGRDLVCSACALGFDRPDRKEAYVSAFLALLDPAIEIVTDPSEPNGGSQRGREHAGELIRTSVADWDAYRVRTKEVIELGGLILVSGRVVARGRGDAAKVELPFASVWTVRDGRVKKIESFSDRAEATAAHGGLE
jgi:ketosteroid isomerase-like protein